MTTSLKTQFKIENLIESLVFSYPENVSYCSMPTEEEALYDLRIVHEKNDNLKAACWRRLNEEFTLLDILNTVEQAELRDSVILQSWETSKTIDGLKEGVNPFTQYYNHPTGIASDFAWMEIGK
jgi:hypothetical protein